MSRVSRVQPHLSEVALKEKIAAAPSARIQQKWMIVYNAFVDPRPADEIAQHTATSLRTVHQVIADYNRLGIAAIETVGKGGRRNQYLTWEAEVAFLEPFVERAIRGELTTSRPIQQAFEQQVGHPVHSSTIYRLLERHGWRKLQPRPEHPEGDTEAQTTFKKTSSTLCKRRLPTGIPKTVALSC
jgi:transposase